MHEEDGTGRLPNIHPGEILHLDFMEPEGITAYRLAKNIGVPATRISEIMKGKRAITADTALRLGRFFETSANFWLNLQAEYDLRETRVSHPKAYDDICAYHPLTEDDCSLARDSEFVTA